MYNSMTFSKFTELYNIPHHPGLEHYRCSKKILIPFYS